MHQCNNICLRFKGTVAGYTNGRKYCRRCVVYYVTKDIFCSCCGTQLRYRAHNGRITRRDAAIQREHEKIIQELFIQCK